MGLQRVGSSTHYFYEYDDVLGTDGLTLINGLMASCENDLFRIDQYLPHQMGSAGDIFANYPVIVRIQTDKNLPGDPGDGPASGAGNNSGNPFASSQSDIIRINPSKSGIVVYALDYVRLVFVAEMAEQSMQAYGWNPGNSQGEGISRWLAYKLYPTSSFVDVNAWVNLDPRPDWINNIFTGNNTTKGDTEPVSYGCSLLFLNYIESQLGLPMREFLLAGGQNLADRYHNLTKLSDDPFQAMNSLLLAHFPKTVSLATNNPFPLYDVTKRKVFLKFPSSTVASKRMEPGGVAHVSPYLTCPQKDYAYIRVGTADTRSVVANTLGFGNPNFTWKVQGAIEFLSSGFGKAIVPTEIPDPNNPRTPTETTSELDYTYQRTESGQQNAKTSTLTLSNTSFDGDYTIEVSVDVTEEQEGDANPITATQRIDLSGLRIQYEKQYYVDQAACEATFEKSLAGIPKLEESIDIVKTLPDPPSDRTLNRVLKAVLEIRRLVKETAKSDPAQSLRIATFAAWSLGVSRDIFSDAKVEGREQHGLSV